MKLYMQFEMDSSRDSTAAGTVYAVIVPDYSLFKGNRSLSSNCEVITNLYRNEEISHFNRLYAATVFLGAGVENGAHFAADVPVVMWTPATTTQYGDRMVLQYDSEKKVKVCVTDKPEVYYPIPSQADEGQCELYYGNNPVKNAEVIINFKNYMNQQSSGNIQPTTRIYFTIWSADEIPHDQEGSGFRINVTMVPQTYVKFGSAASFYFNAQPLGGNDEYVSVAFDVTGYNNSMLAESSVIAGPDCNSSRCRENTPDEFYSKNIITYVSTSHMSPDQSQYTLRNYDKGV